MKPYRNDEELIKMKKFKDEVMSGLHARLKELKEQEITCSLADDKAIMGTYKNEPFCVYYLFVGRSDGEFAGILMTRWKGKDHRAKKPVDVLMEGG